MGYHKIFYNLPIHRILKFKSIFRIYVSLSFLYDICCMVGVVF